jgi:hypothetical protein
MTLPQSSSSRKNLITGLSCAIAIVSLVTASIGLFWQDSEQSFPFTTLQGQTIQIYGQGLYFYDTVFIGAGSRGTDAVMLFLGIPMLISFLILHGRGSLRGTLLLIGTLFYFLYVYAGFALGAVNYNRSFLLYIVLFSASLFTFVLAFITIDLKYLSTHFVPCLPRYSVAIFMLISGMFTAIIWLSPLIAGLIQGKPPTTLSSYYTGRVTDALDLGIITPSTVIAGVLILRRVPMGYLIALSLLVLEIMLLPTILAQTVFQIAAGVSFTPSEILGPITGFVILSLLSLRVAISILRNITELRKLTP